jgi:hypothetical protein
MSQIDDVTESYIIAAGKYFEYKHILLATGFYNQLLVLNLQVHQLRIIDLTILVRLTKKDNLND